MKLLFGTDTYYPSVNGPSYFTQRLAAGFQRRGHEVHVICPSQSMRSTITQHGCVVMHGIASLPVPLYTALRFSPLPFVYNRILSAVQRIKPDVIHIQNHFLIGRALTGIAQKLSIPIVATNHLMPENILVHLQFLSERHRRALNNWLWRDLRRVYNRIETITAPSPVAVEILKDKGITGTVTAISCGIDLGVFNPRQKGGVIKYKYNLPSLPTYMYVGRLDKEKHIDELIKALPLVRRKVDAQLVIAGSGQLRAQLVELAKREHVYDNVVFTGFINDDDLPKVYAACNVFCNAGTAELQSIVTLEAMATGKPVIAANAMALPYLVHNGVNGYTFEPGDIQTLAARLIELLTEQTKREAMGQRSLEIVAPHHIQNTLDAYERLYEAAISRLKDRDDRENPKVLDQNNAALSF
ncbi:MAG TPA: glucosyl transferase [Blastocatellia bacterium]|jgi:glycosyltransferase involved in cell wall biosynthesis|nr:glucosyl transferase [Blastocatellia bacterium]